jgi:hypothetical protein
VIERPDLAKVRDNDRRDGDEEDLVSVVKLEVQATGDRRLIPLGEEDSAFLADEKLVARVVPLRHYFQSA